MTFEETPGVALRERRRSQTRSEVADAALDLFERQGVAATTVEDIAQAAGISPRTFYRLCGTKEQAVLDDVELAASMLTVAAEVDATASLRAQLVAFWRGRLAEIEVDVDGHRRHLRIRRLIADEPTLLAAALRQEHERDEAFVAALAASTGRDLLQLRALAEWLSVLVRLAIEEWLCVADAGGSEGLQAIYDRALAALDGTATL
jgi:AcrR family transcriptional regulator